jgi:hypothetical protein
LGRHHYNFIYEAKVKKENSIMHHDLAIETARLDALVLGRNIQGKLRRDIRATINMPIEGEYKIPPRTYLVDDEPNHFFVLKGTQVWGNVTHQEYEAAKNLRLVEAKVISPDDIRKKVRKATARRLKLPSDQLMRREPAVDSAAKEMHKADAYTELAIVSGRPDLVRAFQDLNKIDPPDEE